MAALEKTPLLSWFLVATVDADVGVGALDSLVGTREEITHTHTHTSYFDIQAWLKNTISDRNGS